MIWTNLNTFINIPILKSAMVSDTMHTLSSHILKISMPLHMPWHMSCHAITYAMACHAMALHGLCHGLCHCMPWHMPWHAYAMAYLAYAMAHAMACHGICRCMLWLLISTSVLWCSSPTVIAVSETVGNSNTWCVRSVPKLHKYFPNSYVSSLPKTSWLGSW